MIALSFAALALTASDTAAGGPAPPVCPHVSIVSKAPWIKRPSPDDFARVYPPAARRDQLSDRVVISCVVTAEGRLDACRVVSDERPGEGFDVAALSLAPKFQAKVPRPGRPALLPAACPWPQPQESPNMVTFGMKFGFGG